MKISYAWLRDYVDLPVGPEELRSSLSGVGLVVESVQAFEGDTVLDVEIPSNRPDCLSHVGIARELAAIYDSEIRIPADRVPSGGTGEVPVRIDDPELCGRYSARILRGIRVAPSPAWLARRLASVGQRPINNIVDATNYVLLELGHPLHAFDLARLQGPAIVVRRARSGEVIRTLDGVDRELDPGKLVIADAAGPVALAGIMGGESSEISAGTTDLLLESAHFDPLCIGKAARDLQLRTEASNRFEKGADPEATVIALERCAALIAKLAQDSAAGAVIDVRPRAAARRTCRLRRERLKLYAVTPVPDTFVSATLEALGFGVESAADGWTVTVPSHRGDVSLEVDLIEEVLRHFGYEKIPSTLPAWRGKGGHLPSADRRSALARLLRSLGYSETLNWTLTDPALQDSFGAGDRPVELKNPLAQDASQLRTQLLPNLIQSLRYNQNHGMESARLFEIGKTFHASEGVKEEEHVAWVATGSSPIRYWDPEPDPPNYYYMKSVLERVLETLGASGITLEATLPDFLNPAQSARVLRRGNSVGWVGALHPSLQESLKLKEPVFFGEVNLTALAETGRATPTYRAVSRFPGTFRDFSFLIDQSIPFASVQECIVKSPPSFFKEMELIDLYSGPKIPSGKVSMALRFHFESEERTLTDAEIQGAFDGITSALRERLAVTPRA